MKMSEGQIRQNFHVDIELAINAHINMKLYVGYAYQSMKFFFDRDDVALPGFSKFFGHMSDEERKHVEKLMKYLNKRGGQVMLNDVKKPDRDAWDNGLTSLLVSLDLEKKVNKFLLNLHEIAKHHRDAHLVEYLENEFLSEQVEIIKKLGNMITRLKRVVSDGMGEYIFDKDLFN